MSLRSIGGNRRWASASTSSPPGAAPPGPPPAAPPVAAAGAVRPRGPRPGPRPPARCPTRWTRPARACCVRRRRPRQAPMCRRPPPGPAGPARPTGPRGVRRGRDRRGSNCVNDGVTAARSPGPIDEVTAGVVGSVTARETLTGSAADGPVGPPPDAGAGTSDGRTEGPGNTANRANPPSKPPSKPPSTAVGAGGAGGKLSCSCASGTASGNSMVGVGPDEPVARWSGGAAVGRSGPGAARPVAGLVALRAPATCAPWCADRDGGRRRRRAAPAGTAARRPASAGSARPARGWAGRGSAGPGGRRGSASAYPGPEGWSTAGSTSPDRRPAVAGPTTTSPPPGCPPRPPRRIRRRRATERSRRGNRGDDVGDAGEQWVGRADCRLDRRGLVRLWARRQPGSGAPPAVDRVRSGTRRHLGRAGGDRRHRSGGRRRDRALDRDLGEAGGTRALSRQRETTVVGVGWRRRDRGLRDRGEGRAEPQVGTSLTDLCRRRRGGG